MQWCLIHCFILVAIFTLNVFTFHHDPQIVYPKLYHDTMHIIEIDSLILELNSKSDIILETSRIQWIGANGAVSHKNDTTNCDYKMGIVRGMRFSSKVAVTICDEKEVTGYFQFGSIVYVIQPLRANNSVTHGVAHVIYEGKGVV